MHVMVATRPHLQAEADANGGDAQLDLVDAAGEEHDGQDAHHEGLPRRDHTALGLPALQTLLGRLPGAAHRSILRIPAGVRQTLKAHVHSAASRHMGSSYAQNKLGLN